jgi:uncharacterized membrane protein YqiK
MNIFNISINKLYKYFYLIILVVCFFAFILISCFLYNNFYKIIAQTEEVLILKKEVAIEDIDMNKFDSVIKKIEAKNKYRNIEIDINF